MFCNASSCVALTRNPFSVLSFEKQPSKPPIPLSQARGCELLIHSITPTITPFPDHTSDEKFLFHHYVNHVGTIMMPYEHPQNPWTSHYPAMALELGPSRQSCLYNALISHAAFNVSRLLGWDTGYMHMGWKYYSIAIKPLVETIGREELNFSATMASIMTLMFAEVG